MSLLPESGQAWGAVVLMASAVSKEPIGLGPSDTSKTTESLLLSAAPLLVEVRNRELNCEEAVAAYFAASVSGHPVIGAAPHRILCGEGWTCVSVLRMGRR